MHFFQIWRLSYLATKRQKNAGGGIKKIIYLEQY